MRSQKGPAWHLTLWTITMRSRGGLTLLGVLFIPVVLCHSEFALQCYSCVDPVSFCNETTRCHLDLDACAIVKAGPRIYHQCWKYKDCTFEEFSKRLGEPELTYRCCQKKLCNRDFEKPVKEKGGTVTLSGKTILVVPLVLVTSWNCFL